MFPIAKIDFSRPIAQTVATPKRDCKVIFGYCKKVSTYTGVISNSRIERKNIK
jgi:hypothetical protein